MNRRIKDIHFVGIGGIGMSGLAEILQASGYSVSGSDLCEGPTTERLRRIGIEVTIGHEPAAIVNKDVVVYSAAIPANNSELKAAAARQIPVIPRAEMLAELMRMKYGIAIAGSHGKTTTTSMVGTVLQAGGLDPTIIVGGIVRSLGTNSHLGEGDVLVAEADESDGSFLRLIPTIVVVTNIDYEHLDHYEHFDRLKESFLDFCNRAPFYGGCVVCLDDPAVQELLPQLSRRTQTYGLSTQADFSADHIETQQLETRFRVRGKGKKLGEIQLQTPGVHNVRNALAAIAVGLEFDVPFDKIQRALSEFRGVARRFEVCGEVNGILVVDDYAHHPSEIRATLAAARDGFGRRTVAVFQPHRYTRTRDLFEEFVTAFHDAQVLIVTDIYPAGEPKIPGIEAEALAEAARERGHRNVHFIRETDQIFPTLRSVVRSGDLVIFLGAGDIGRIARSFLEQQGGSTD